MGSIRMLQGVVLLGVLAGSTLAYAAAPPAGSAAAHATRPHAQQKELDAKVAAERARHDALQAEVAKLEQQNATRQQTLQQRDAEIAALQQKLDGAHAPAASAGH